MKQWVLCVFVMMAFVFIPALQAEVRVIDRAGEINQKIDAMRARIAAEGHSYEVSMNPAMNYSLDQLCTLNPSLAAAEGMVSSSHESGLSRTMVLPSYYTGCMTPVKNQASCGTVAFGVIGTVEGTWKKILGAAYDYSEQHLVDCCPDASCYGGWFTAFDCITYPNFFKWEADCPYVGFKQSPSPCCGPPYADYITAWYYVDNNYSVPTTTAIKQKIYDYGNVAAAVYVNTAFMAYSRGCYTSNYSGNVNHFIILYGWNDDICEGIWNLKNSWGTGWGENGTMRIGYGKQQVGYAACYVVY